MTPHTSYTETTLWTAIIGFKACCSRKLQDKPRCISVCVFLFLLFLFCFSMSVVQNCLHFNSCGGGGAIGCCSPIMDTSPEVSFGDFT